MLGLLERCPDMYLDEIQEQLEEQNNIVVSLATIYRTLHRLGITSKKVQSFAVALVWLLHIYSYLDNSSRGPPKNAAKRHIKISC